MLTTTADGHLTTDTTGPVELRRLLAIFEGEMERVGWTGSGRQAPGHSREKIVTAFQSVNLSPPDELVTYFEWHDSVIAQDGAWFGPVYPGFSPERMSWCLKAYRQVLESDFDGGEGKSGWLLLEQGGGYAVDCGGGPRDVPEVLYVSEDDPIEGPRDKPRMLSMCTIVEGWISLIRAGAYYWHENGWRANPSLAPMVEPREALVMFV